MKNQAMLSRNHQGGLYPRSMSLDRRIHAVRKHMKLTQPEFAARFNVSPQAANQWEKPERPSQARKPARPSKDNLAEMARISGARLEWIMSGAGNMFDDHVTSEEIAGTLDDAHHIESTEIAADKETIDPDSAPTVGEYTGRRGIPIDGIAQLDVTAGMGGGGLTIISEGVPGRKGMTFAAEHVRDYWRLPPDLLVGMGLREHDIIVMPVQGDSMYPTLTEGEFVFVDTRHRLPSPDGLYALGDDFGGLVVKRLESLGIRDEDVWVKVISDNTERHSTYDRRLSEIHIVGRIVRRFGVIG